MLARRQLLALIAGLAFTVSGCTVEPLHSSSAEGAAEKPDVFIEQVNSRVAQQVRDRLIFLLQGGSRQSETAAVRAKLTISSSASGILSVQRDSSDSDTTASRLLLTGTITLRDSQTGEELKTYTRQSFASFDRSTQQFANDRAQIEAENRAAAELAAELRNLVLAYMRTR